MTSATLSDSARTNFVSLCEETLAVIGPLIGVLGYAGLAFIQNTTIGRALPMTASVSAVLLILSGVAAYGLRARRQTLAMWLVVWGTFVAGVLMVATVRATMASYLLIVPIILANSLLQRRLVLITALAALTFMVFVVPAWVGPVRFIEVLLPTALMALVTVTAWMASRNLNTTLNWLSHAYEGASHQEALLRVQGGDLRRAFKDLDDATSRLDRANLRLADERNQADEARRLKQQFAQTISHELRTPLNLIVAFTDLMAQSPELYGTPLPPAYMRDLVVVQRNAQHLQTLVNDVLELSQVESTQMGVLFEPTQPEQMVSDAANMVCSLVQARGLTLTVNVEDNLPPVWVDATRVRQVLINLLNNAVKFTEQGGITVGAWLEAAQNRVVFSVKDTGAGIDPNDVPRLFQEFSQLNGGTRRKHGGTGLGLVISKRFVQLHDGSIWVESLPGAGSTFFFSLPLGRDEHNVTWVGRGNARLPYTGKRITLVVTGSTSAAGMLSRHIRESQVILASTLEEARVQARQYLPQLVVFDSAHVMLDADQAQQFLVACELTHSLALVCCLPSEETLREQIGAQRYLIKPVTREQVLTAIEEVAPATRRVLVIDDDPDFVRLMRRFLDSALLGYRLYSAYSGSEGLEMLQQAHPDLIVLDMQLNDMRGHQLAEQIRARPNFAHVPIIVISAQEITQVLDAARATSPCEAVVMNKANGFTTGELVRMIEHATEHISLPSVVLSTGHLSEIQ